jgi:hypothetical protein
MEEGQTLLEPLISDDNLYRVDITCQGQNDHYAPVLYAHFLEQGVKEELCSLDPLSEHAGVVSCAPGPILLAQGHAIDSLEKEWILPALPDYFAWHIDSPASVNETLYIANATGFPIKSQIVKLESDGVVIMVLFPKTNLLPGASYYLYLTLNSEGEEKRWIQPITTTASGFPPKTQITAGNK